MALLAEFGPVVVCALRLRMLGQTGGIFCPVLPDHHLTFGCALIYGTLLPWAQVEEQGNYGLNCHAHKHCCACYPCLCAQLKRPGMQVELVKAMMVRWGSGRGDG